MSFSKPSYLSYPLFLVLYLLVPATTAESVRLLEPKTPKEAVHPDQTQGVGALGRIEPQTRIVHVSHNAGPEGAKVEKLFFQEGNVVEKNQTLAILSDHEKRKAEVAVAKAQITVLETSLASEKITHAFNEKEYRRYLALSKTSAASASLTDQKQLAFQQSNAAMNELQAKIASARSDLEVAEANLANTLINAPQNGTVIKVHTRPGERIGDKGLLEMADLTQLDVVAEVYEADLPKVKVGQKADIRLIGFPEPYKAEVREIGYQVRKNDLNDTDPLADKDNRIIEVRLTLERQAVAHLQHQMFRQVQVRIIP